MNKKRLGILGSGYLSGIVVDAWKQGLLEDYEIVGVMGRTPETVSEMAKKAGCAACLTLDELLAQKPDYIAEAASVQMVKDSAEKILSSGSSLIVLSIGALLIRNFMRKPRRLQRKTAQESILHPEQSAVLMYCAQYL